MFMVTRPVFLILGVLLIGPGLVFGQKTDDGKASIKIDEISKRSRTDIDTAAPGVEWKQARFEKAFAYSTEGKLMESKVLVVSGQDKKGRAVVARVSSRNKIMAVRERIAIFVTVTAEELPPPVRAVLLERASLGKCLEVIAVGRTTKPPYEYRLAYASGGRMVISADGQRVEVQTIAPSKK